MRRVLFIAYLFPPIANSGTRRSLSFANLLPDFGWSPVVLTVADPPEQALRPRLAGGSAAGDTHRARTDGKPLVVVKAGLPRRYGASPAPGRRPGVEIGLACPSPR